MLAKNSWLIVFFSHEFLAMRQAAEAELRRRTLAQQLANEEEIRAAWTWGAGQAGAQDRHPARHAEAIDFSVAHQPGISDHLKHSAPRGVRGRGVHIHTYRPEPSSLPSC